MHAPSRRVHGMQAAGAVVACHFTFHQQQVSSTTVETLHSLMAVHLGLPCRAFKQEEQRRQEEEQERVMAGMSGR